MRTRKRERDIYMRKRMKKEIWKKGGTE